MEHKIYKIDPKMAVGEVIDGEAVIINLQSGQYFSADGVGAEIWSCIENNLSIDAITDHIGKRYQGTPNVHNTAILAFIKELEANNLVIGSNDSVSGDGNSMPEESASNSELKEFITPILNSFSDMKDLLLLDPIHDVSEEAGWPAQKE